MRRACIACCSALVALLARGSGTSEGVCRVHCVLFGAGGVAGPAAASEPGEPKAELEYFRVEVRGELRLREVFVEPDSAVTRPNRAPDYESFTIRVGRRSWVLLLDAKAAEAARKLRGKRVDVSGSLEPEGIRVKGLKETGGK